MPQLRRSVVTRSIREFTLTSPTDMSFTIMLSEVQLPSLRSAVGSLLQPCEVCRQGKLDLVEIFCPVIKDSAQFYLYEFVRDMLQPIDEGLCP